MITFEGFKKPDGTTDWAAFHTAQRNVGEICRSCKVMIYPGRGFPTRCNKCVDFEQGKGEFTGHRIRCPKCREPFYVSDQYEIYGEGEHELMCQECEYRYTIQTHVNITFTSPAPLTAAQPVERETSLSPEREN